MRIDPDSWIPSAFSTQKPDLRACPRPFRDTRTLKIPRDDSACLGSPTSDEGRNQGDEQCPGFNNPKEKRKERQETIDRKLREPSARSLFPVLQTSRTVEGGHPTGQT